MILILRDEMRKGTTLNKWYPLAKRVRIPIEYLSHSVPGLTPLAIAARGTTLRDFPTIRVYRIATGIGSNGCVKLCIDSFSVFHAAWWLFSRIFGPKISPNIDPKTGTDAT